MDDQDLVCPQVQHLDAGEQPDNYSSGRFEVLGPVTIVHMSLINGTQCTSSFLLFSLSATRADFDLNIFSLYKPSDKMLLIFCITWNCLPFGKKEASYQKATEAFRPQ